MKCRANKPYKLKRPIERLRVGKKVNSFRTSKIESNLFNTDTKGTEPQVSALQRCPGIMEVGNGMIFGISGTKRTVRIIKVFVRRG